MNQFSIDNNIKYDQEYVSNKIEDIIDTTKIVNNSANSKSQNTGKDWLI
jgi:hypothetical protein